MLGFCCVVKECSADIWDKCEKCSLEFCQTHFISHDTKCCTGVELDISAPLEVPRINGPGSTVSESDLARDFSDNCKWITYFDTICGNFLCQSTRGEKEVIATVFESHDAAKLRIIYWHSSHATFTIQSMSVSTYSNLIKDRCVAYFYNFLSFNNL